MIFKLKSVLLNINNEYNNINVLSVMRACTIANKNQINSLAFHRSVVNVLPFHASLRCIPVYYIRVRSSITLKSVIISE